MLLNPAIVALLLFTVTAGTPAQFAAKLEPEAHLQLVKGSGQAGIELYSIILRLDPNRASAYDARGMGYAEEGKYDLAIADYTSAIGLDPKNGYLHAGRGAAQAKKGDLDKAVADFTEAIRLGCRSYLERGEVYVRKGKLDLAIADFTEAIRVNPKDPEPFQRRRDVYLARREWKKAIADYSSEIDLHPQVYNGHDSAYWSRARLHLKIGEPDQALADFQEAAKQDSRFDSDGEYGWIGAGVSGNVPGWIVTDYTELIRLSPKNTQAIWRRAEAYERGEQYGKAIADYSEVLRRDPHAYRPLLKRGESYLKNGEADKAVADLTAVIQLKLKFVTIRALYQRGDAYRKLGQWEKAVADYEAEIRLDVGPKGHYFEGESHAGLGAVYYAQGSFGRAIEEYDKAVKAGLLGDAEKAVYRGLGDSYQKQGDRRKAIDMYAEAVLHDWGASWTDELPAIDALIKTYPKCASLYCCRADAHLQHDEPHKAIEDLSEAMRLEPNLIDRLYPFERYDFDYRPRPALLTRAEIFEKQGDFARALADYAELTRVDHDSKEGYEGRLRLDTRRGDLGKIIADCTELIRLNPLYEEDAYIERAGVYLKKGDLDKAIDDYTHVAEAYEQSSDAYCGRGTAYMKKGEVDKALADFTKGTQGFIRKSYNYACGLSAASYSGLGDAYAAKGKLDQAIDDYTIAMAIDLHAPAPVRGRGIAYVGKKEWDKAITDLTAAIKLDSHDGEAFHNRGLAYQRRGDRIQATKDFDQAKKLGYRRK